MKRGEDETPTDCILLLLTITLSNADSNWFGIFSGRSKKKEIKYTELNLLHSLQSGDSFVLD